MKTQRQPKGSKSPVCPIYSIRHHSKLIVPVEPTVADAKQTQPSKADAKQTQPPKADAKQTQPPKADAKQTQPPKGGSKAPLDLPLGFAAFTEWSKEPL